MRRMIRTAAVLVAGMFLQVQAAAAQVVCQLGSGNQFNLYYNQPPSPYAASVLQTIYRLLCPTGCGQVNLFLNESAPNALTMTFGGGQSLIAYRSGFMGQVHTVIGPEATFGIIAHEFGHHIDLNTTPPWMNDNWGRELRADAWAGCALARRGFGSEQLSRALQAIAAYPSPSHPAWTLRIPAVEQGFRACGGRVKRLPWR